MLELIKEIFSYHFMVRAFIVGGLVALCASLLGVTLVLKRFSMIGDGLSHVGFGALSVAMVMNTAPLAIAVPIVIAAAFFILWISENGKMKGDAAIGLISSSAIAIGITITALSNGMNADVYSYMFGSVLSMQKSDVILSVLLSIAVLSMFLFLYDKIFSVTFDESFTKASGIKTGYYNILLALLTAITIVVGMRIMGTMLISGLIIFPALSSMRVFQSFRSVIVSSAVISVFCFFSGIIISYLFSIPTGASIVLTNLSIFLLFTVIGKMGILR